MFVTQDKLQTPWKKFLHNDFNKQNSHEIMFVYIFRLTFCHYLMKLIIHIHPGYFTSTNSASIPENFSHLYKRNLFKNINHKLSLPKLINE